MKLMRRWGAVVILFLMFAGSWIGQLVTQAYEARNDAKTHGEPVTGMWSEFWPQFWAATFENWQSEFLQLAFQAILIAGPLQYVLFRADQGADKKDVQKILDRLDSIHPESTSTDTTSEEA